jgi:psiF repeat
MRREGCARPRASCVFLLKVPAMKFSVRLLSLLLAASPVLSLANETVPANAHKDYKLKFSACNASAKEQKLVGDELRKYVADCMKQAPVAAPKS